MRLKNAARFVALVLLVAACNDSSDTVEYTVQVTAIEVVQKGGDQRLDVEGLPSAFGRLVAPQQGRFPSQTP